MTLKGRKSYYETGRCSHGITSVYFMPKTASGAWCQRLARPPGADRLGIRSKNKLLTTDRLGMFFVYVLQNQKKQIYIGQTSDLNNRLRQHNNNKSKYTKNKGPWRIIYYKTFRTRAEAMKAEKLLKSGKGREWIKSTF